MSEINKICLSLGIFNLPYYYTQFGIFVKEFLFKKWLFKNLLLRFCVIIKNVKKNILILLSSLFLFIIITLLIISHSSLLINIDNHINNLVVLNNSESFLFKISLFFTKIMDPLGSLVIISFICIFYLFKKKKYDLFLALISFGLAISSSSAIKVLIDRERPIGYLIEENTKSFPSNHSMASIIVLFLVFHLIKYYIGNKKTKYIFLAIVTLILLFIPMTRILLGVHFASDVIAGLSLGVFFYYFTGLVLSTLSDKRANCGVCLK